MAQAAALILSQLSVPDDGVRQPLLQQLSQHRLVLTAATRALEGPLARLAAILPETEQAAARLMTRIDRFLRAQQETPLALERLFTTDQADAPPDRDPEDGTWSNYHQTGDVGRHDAAEVFRSGNLRERMNALGNCQAKLLPLLSEVTRRAKADPVFRAELIAQEVNIDFLLKHYEEAGDRDKTEIIEALSWQPSSLQKMMRQAYAAKPTGESFYAAEYNEQLNRQHANPRRRTDGLISPPLSQREIDQARVGAKKEVKLAVIAKEKLLQARAKDEQKKRELVGLPPVTRGSTAEEFAPTKPEVQPLAQDLEPMKEPFEMPHRDGGLLFRPNDHKWHAQAAAAAMFSKVSISGTTFRLVFLQQIFDPRPGGQEALRWAIIGHLVPAHHTYHEVMSALADHGFPYEATPAALVHDAKNLLDKFQSEQPSSGSVERFQRERVAELQRSLMEVEKYLEATKATEI